MVMKTYTIKVLLECDDATLAMTIRDEIVSTLESLHPLEAAWQVSKPVASEDGFVKALGELCN